MARNTTSIPESGVTPCAALDAVFMEMMCDLVGGETDCCQSAGRAFRSLWGVDVFPRWGRYETMFGGRKKLRALGMTLPQAVSKAALDAGLMVAAEHPGALGLVKTDSPAFGGYCAAICIRPGEWAAKTLTGFGLTDSSVAIWGVKCRN